MTNRNAYADQALKKELSDKQLDLAIEIALTEMLNREFSEPGSSTSEELEAHIANSYAKGVAYIKKNASLRARIANKVPRAFSVAAGVVLVLMLSLSSALAFSSSFRSTFWALITKKESRYTELAVREEESYRPAEWNGAYYPRYIPDDFSASFIGDIFVEYINEEKQTFSFWECEAADTMRFDSEDAQGYPLPINGITAFMVKRDGFTYMYWKIEKKFFMVEGNISDETLIEIASSVSPIL